MTLFTNTANIEAAASMLASNTSHGICQPVLPSDDSRHDRTKPRMRGARVRVFTRATTPIRQNIFESRSMKTETTVAFHEAMGLPVVRMGCFYDLQIGDFGVGVLFRRFGVLVVGFRVVGRGGGRCTV